MIDPHAHHILFKKGHGKAQQKLVEEGQAILRKHGIDPIKGIENLTWAPNRVKGQHSINALQHAVNELKEVDELVDVDSVGHQAMVDKLKELGQIAAKRK